MSIFETKSSKAISSLLVACFVLCPLTAQPQSNNVVALNVDAGVPGYTSINRLFVTVTVCDSNSNCQAIDHVLLDTGSTGLRLLDSSAGGQFVSGNYTAGTFSSSTSAAGAPMYECMSFGAGNTWGPIMQGDISLGSKVASAALFQVIMPSSYYPQGAGACARYQNIDSLSRMHFNGVLGISTDQEDCGSLCSSGSYSVYYSCSSSSCSQVSLPNGDQLQNPVSLFASDNNGTIIDLPAVSSEGQTSVSGSLIFGIGTQSNNGLGDAIVYPGTYDSSLYIYTIKTVYNGSSYAAFIDSGSPILSFLSSAQTGLALCSDGANYCPSSPTSATFTNTSSNGSLLRVQVPIGNFDSLLNSGNIVFNNLAGSYDGAIDYGLSFFFGRRVYTAIAGRSTPAGNGPYWAYNGGTSGSGSGSSGTSGSGSSGSSGGSSSGSGGGGGGAPDPLFISALGLLLLSRETLSKFQYPKL